MGRVSADQQLYLFRSVGLFTAVIFALRLGHSGEEEGNHAEKAHEVPRAMLFGMATLGLACVVLGMGANGGLARCKIKDPSLNNWPALPEAVQGNIIPDFPVINKSFNLSYSGTDR